METVYEFTLPKGYMDGAGSFIGGGRCVWLRQGMRLVLPGIPGF